MMRKTILLLFILSFIPLMQAQEDDNPIDVLAEKLYENEMLSFQFLRDFVLIKSNVFEDKITKNMDKSIARFDDNLGYIALHLPKDLRPKYNELQKQWNIYRMAIINPEIKDYKRLVTATINIEKISQQLRIKTLEKHPDYKNHKKVFHLLDRVIENQKNINKILVIYIFKNQLNFPIIENALESNFSDVQKNIKKLFKSKILAQKQQHVVDMKNTLISLQKIYQTDTNSAKLLYSKVKYFSNKNYILFKELIKHLKK